MGRACSGPDFMATFRVFSFSRSLFNHTRKCEQINLAGQAGDVDSPALIKQVVPRTQQNDSGYWIDLNCAGSMD